MTNDLLILLEPSVSFGDYAYFNSNLKEKCKEMKRKSPVK